MRFPSRTPRPPRVARGRPTAAPIRHNDTHLTHAQTPIGIGIDAQMPNSMPRAEDDAATLAGSPEFHDRPGSGKLTKNRQFVF